MSKGASTSLPRAPRDKREQARASMSELRQRQREGERDRRIVIHIYCSPQSSRKKKDLRSPQVSQRLIPCVILLPAASTSAGQLGSREFQETLRGDLFLTWLSLSPTGPSASKSQRHEAYFSSPACFACRRRVCLRQPGPGMKLSEMTCLFFGLWPTGILVLSAPQFDVSGAVAPSLWDALWATSIIPALYMAKWAVAAGLLAILSEGAPPTPSPMLPAVPA